jgi:LacI family gluconate utilization system Gnt-I transcriptional repressor
MEDVARAAGVSAITVSRALNAPDKLAPATLRAVRDAIDRLRYVANLTAGSLASNRSRIVAVIVPTIANSIFAETVGGLANALAHHGYQLLLGQTGYRLEEEASLVGAFLGRRVDGLVLTGVTHARGVRGGACGTPGLRWSRPGTLPPARSTCGRIPGLTSGPRRRRTTRSRRGAARSRSSEADDRSAKRLEGFGTPPASAAPARCSSRRSRPASPGEGAEALALLGRGRPDAVFCSNDTIAAGVLFECARRRIAVPRDLAVMGFADLPIAAAIEPTLTSIQVRATEMGSRAAAMLLARLTGEAPRDRIVDLGFEIVERASA